MVWLPYGHISCKLFNFFKDFLCITFAWKAIICIQFKLLLSNFTIIFIIFCQLFRKVRQSLATLCHHAAEGRQTWAICEMRLLPTSAPSYSPFHSLGNKIMKNTGISKWKLLLHLTPLGQGEETTRPRQSELHWENGLESKTCQSQVTFHWGSQRLGTLPKDRVHWQTKSSMCVRLFALQWMTPGCYVVVCFSFLRVFLFLRKVSSFEKGKWSTSTSSGYY